MARHSPRLYVPPTPRRRRRSRELVQQHHHHNDHDDDHEDDDSVSISAILTVDRRKAAVHSSSSRRRNSGNTEKKKTVRFDIEANIAHKNSSYYGREEIQGLWYTKEDVATFGRNVRRHEDEDHESSAYCRLLREAYEACCCEALLHEEESECTTVGPLLSEARRQDLRDAMRGDARRLLGVECHAVRHLGEERRRLRKEIVATILNLQEVSAMEEMLVCDPADMQEYVREESQRISRPSRLFAQTLAATLAIVR